MQSIYVYDTEAKDLDEIASENDMSIADAVEMLVLYYRENKRS